jgi:hypothetical protein
MAALHKLIHQPEFFHKSTPATTAGTIEEHQQDWERGRRAD